MTTNEAFTDVRASASKKYTTLARLGQGGMADVFLAVARGPVGFNKLVVIKRLKDELLLSPEHRTMFLDEARLAARLSHPNVVQTYEITEEGDSFLITMEYLDGQPLSSLMQKTERAGRRLPPSVYAHLAAEALVGLHYAHELADYDGTPLKIVHRDVSPQNIFLTFDGQVKIVDFGIAKAEVSSDKTQAGMLKGKAAYMAPEQLAGEADCRADVFTMGIVLWELVTGRRLMAAGSTAKTLIRVLNERLPAPSEGGPSVDPALEAIIMRALERDPAKRYQTAREMRDALEAFIAARSNPVRQEDIARILQEMFGEARAATRARVREKMAALATHASGSMPALRVDSVTGRRVAIAPGPEVTGAPSSVWSVPSLVVPANSSSMAPRFPPTHSAIAAHAPPPRSRAVWLAAVIAIGSAGGGVYVAREQAAAHAVASPVAVEAPSPVHTPPPSAVTPSFAAAAPPPVESHVALPPAPPAPPPPPPISADAAAKAAPPHVVWRAPARAAATPYDAPSPPAHSVPVNAAPSAALPAPATAPAAVAAPAPPPAVINAGRRLRTEY